MTLGIGGTVVICLLCKIVVFITPNLYYVLWQISQITLSWMSLNHLVLMNNVWCPVHMVTRRMTKVVWHVPVSLSLRKKAQRKKIQMVCHPFTVSLFRVDYIVICTCLTHPRENSKEVETRSKCCMVLNSRSMSILHVYQYGVSCMYKRPSLFNVLDVVYLPLSFFTLYKVSWNSLKVVRKMKT